MTPEQSEKVQEIFQQYQEVVQPLAMQYEILTNTFPVAILNEIRAVFTHLARCHTATSDSAVQKNVSGARRHLVRTLRDCFKYLCIAYEDKYREFCEQYRNVDLSEADNGDFLPLLTTAYAEAIGSLQAAKELEIEGKDDQPIHNAYQESCVKYRKVYTLITDAAKFERLLHKQSRKDRFALWSFVASVAGAVIGAFGTWLAMRK